MPFGPYEPTVTGTVTGYSVSPALPAGLSLDPTLGVIAGTPLTASPESIYRITASNERGAATFALSLAVLVPPSALSYPSPVNGTVGVALSSLVPTYSGDADSFAIRPALPAGLILDPTTGVVSGTPTNARVPATYTIAAGITLRGVPRTTFNLLLGVGAPPAGTVVTGVFRDSTVTGLGFVSGAQSGVTNDSGEFTYETGQGITFSVGQVSIGAMPIAKSLITPVDLVANGTGDSNHVLNVVRFLLMLDLDGEPSNGIQISTAVTAAAAGWAPVDFDSADLPTTLGPLIQLASAADAVTHVLPDAASAQARLRSEFYCTYSGRYFGSYAGISTPGDRGPFTVEVYPDGSVHSIAGSTATLAGFDVVTANALNPLLDASFALNSQSPSISLQGSFTDPTFLNGTYLADSAGTFEAAGETAAALTYKFVGTYTKKPVDPTLSESSGLAVLGMDDSNEVSGTTGDFLAGSGGGNLHGTVTGDTFEGTITVREHQYGGRWVLVSYPVSGTFSNTDLGYTLEGQYFDVFGALNGGADVTISAVGCRAN